MYGHAQPLNMPNQIAASADEDDVSGAGTESIDNSHIRYDAHSLDDTAGAVVEVVEDVASDAVYGQGGGGGAAEIAIQRHDGTSQLTLSFRGQVYVFDSVTPEKVRFFSFFFFFVFLGELYCLGFLSFSFDVLFGCREVVGKEKKLNF